MSLELELDPESESLLPAGNLKARKKKSVSPTQLTLLRLRNLKFTYQIVEYYNAQSMRRVDLFGIIDILAIDAKNQKVWGIQTTSGSNHASRVNKALAEKRLHRWISTGCIFEVWSWNKYVKKKGWVLRRSRFVKDPSKSDRLLVNEIQF